MATPLFDSVVTRASTTPEWSQTSEFVRTIVLQVLAKQREEGDLNLEVALTRVVAELEEHVVYHQFSSALADIVAGELSDRSWETESAAFLENLLNTSCQLLQEVYQHRPLLRAPLHELLINTPLTFSLRRMVWGAQLHQGIQLPRGMSLCQGLLNSNRVPKVSEAVTTAVASWPGWDKWVSIHNASAHQLIAAISIVVSTTVTSVTMVQASMLAIPLVFTFGTGLDLKTFCTYMTTIIDGITLATDQAQNATPPFNPNLLRNLTNLFVEIFSRDTVLHIWDQLIISGFRIAPLLWRAIGRLVDRAWSPDKASSVTRMKLVESLSVDITQKKAWSKKPAIALKDDSSRGSAHKYIGKLLSRRVMYEIDLLSTHESVKLRFSVSEMFLLFVPEAAKIGDLTLTSKHIAQSILAFRPNLDTLKRIIHRMFPIVTVFCVNHPVRVPMLLYQQVASIVQTRRRKAQLMNTKEATALQALANAAETCDLTFNLKGIEFQYGFTNVPMSGHQAYVDGIFRQLGWLKSENEIKVNAGPFCPKCNDKSQASFDPLNVSLCTCPVHFDWSMLDHREAQEQSAGISVQLQAWTSKSTPQKLRRTKTREEFEHLAQDAALYNQHASFQLSRALRVTMTSVKAFLENAKTTM